jgi:predicted MPP superfamily phosphohydrolase
MKTNPHLHWDKKFRRAERFVHHAAFLAVGGLQRFARRQAGRFIVRRYTIAFPHLPPAWHGLTITHLSDFHFSRTFTPEHHLPPVLEACRRLDSDLVVMTGDWVDSNNEPLTPALPLLQQLQPRLGWWGILGNHDASENRWRLILQLREWLGDRLLINRAGILERDGQKIVLLGLDYAWGGPKLQRHVISALAHCPPDLFTIALVHHPQAFHYLRDAKIPLTLAGHTHGGQWSLTPAPHRSIGPAMFHFPWLRGWYRDYQSRLYVSAGLGGSVPLRINCPPEIVQYTLQRSRT